MQKLLKISFVVSFLGIFLLLLLSTIQKPRQVNSYEDLKLRENVKTTGKIISINSFNDFSIVKLDNNITITCNCKLQENKTITLGGKVTEYENKLQIQAENIKIIENVI